MEPWNAQKMLDLYIHDYLVRKNMRSTADILAEEAGIEPRTVGANPPEGFLVEWWDLFWSTYSSRPPRNPQTQGDRGSSSSTQAANPAPMGPVADTGSRLLTSFPARPPNRSRQQLMARSMSQRAREQDHPRLPIRNFGYGPNVFNFDEVARMLSMIEESGEPMDEDVIAPLLSTGDASDNMDTHAAPALRRMRRSP